mmetsp:Transcript_6704/g.8106  ORF Transcript_6704/g.8106 Transcript_6704/m.8106 type:complete len:304 (-) Transcript_6704:88-999(-)
MWSGLVDQIGQDLNEFVATVKGDTTAVLQNVSEKLAAQVEGNENQGSTEEVAEKKESLGSFPYSSRAQPFVSRLVEDPTILLAEGLEANPEFERFSSSFKLSEENDEITNLLRDESNVRPIYGDFVPSKMTHKEFWMRYFFLQTKLRLSLHRVGEIEMQEEDLTWGHDEEGENGWGDEDLSSLPEESKNKDELPVEDSSVVVENLKAKVNSLTVELEQAQSKLKEMENLRLENEELKLRIKEITEISENADNEGSTPAVAKHSNETEKNTAEESESTPLESPQRSAGSSEDNGSWEQDFPEWE